MRDPVVIMRDAAAELGPESPLGIELMEVVLGLRTYTGKYVVTRDALMDFQGRGEWLKKNAEIQATRHLLDAADKQCTTREWNKDEDGNSVFSATLIVLPGGNK